nr:VOC family protein [Modestobacter muralis]
MVGRRRRLRRDRHRGRGRDHRLRPRPEAHPELARGEEDGLLRPTPDRRRLHLDLNATDRTQADELDRLLALGATPVDVGQGPLTPETTWHVLADPEGDEFCLLASTVDPLSGGAPRT